MRYHQIETLRLFWVSVWSWREGVRADHFELKDPMLASLPVYDRRVHHVARVAAQVARPLGLYLFGSRARGDYRPDSDIDLLMVMRQPCDPQTYGQTGVDAHCVIRAGRALDLDLLAQTQQTCLTMARARNHVVRQARREGVLMYGASLPLYDENEPTENWPDVRERIRATQSALNAMAYLLDDDPSTERWFGFLGQQALENALKGYLAALDMRYDHTHNLLKLIEQINALADSTLQEPSAQWLKWLNQYAVEYRCTGAAQGGIADRRTFCDDIQSIVADIRHRILTLTGRPDFES